MSKPRSRIPSRASTSRTVVWCIFSNTALGRWHGEEGDYLWARRPTLRGIGRFCFTLCEWLDSAYVPDDEMTLSGLDRSIFPNVDFSLD